MPTWILSKWTWIGVAMIALFATGWWLGDSLKQGEWDAARVKEAEAVAVALKEAHDQAMFKERELTQKLNSQSKQYQTKLQEKDREKAAALERFRSDGLRISVEASAGQNGVPGDPANSCRCDGGTTAKLSDEVAQRLVERRTEADKIVEQLTACQGILKEITNGK